MRGRQPWAWITLKCDNCQKSFGRSAARVRADYEIKNFVYCSRECANVARPYFQLDWSQAKNGEFLGEW